jgi:prevent-host-death family protein
MAVEVVPVTTLNRQTAQVLETVKRGNVVRVTDHGKVVAVISPPAEPSGSPLLDALISNGRAKPAKHPGVLPTPMPAAGPLDTAATDALLDERYGEDAR